MTTPQPNKILNYPIPGDETGGRLFLFGNPNAQRIIFFCPGYPDDHSSFSPLAARLAKELDAFCGVTCLAGYDDSPEKSWTSFRSEGYTTEEWVQALRTASKIFRQEATHDKVVFTNIFHDWGSLVGCTFANRVLEEKDPLLAPNQIVYFDILPFQAHKDEPNRPPPEQHSGWRIFIETLYRVLFALASCVYHRISKYPGILMYGANLRLLEVLGLSPFYHHDWDTIRSRKLDPSRITYMLFPYQNLVAEMLQLPSNLYKDLLFSFYTASAAMKSFESFHLPLLDQVPVLFLYGSSKRVQLHDQNVADLLRQHAGKSDSVGVQNAGHWAHLQQPDVCFEAVKKFIEIG
jgi:pimeloyl-ACP methyl ester carboxylesterase